MGDALREAIVIVGPGRAGITLGRLWQRAGHRVAAVVGGGPGSLASAHAVLGIGVSSATHAEALGAGTFVVIAVPDDRLDEAVDALAKGPVASPPPLVVHL